MKISSEKLTGLIVETQSVQKIGRVESFNIDIDSQSILEYKIKPSNLVEGLIKGDLIISRGQVIDITDKKMIVDDNAVKQKSKRKLKLVKEKVTQGAMMKEEKLRN